MAAAGSFSLVARRQNVAVSSITRKIDALESEMGSRLFHRSSRRLVLTDAGEQFVPRARNVIAELAEAKEAILAQDAGPRGLLSVTAPTVFGRQHVLSAVASFLHRYPDIEVDLHLTDQIVDLTEQRMDVAVRIGLLPDSDLYATQLAQVRLVTCASPAYLAHAGRPASVADLLSHQCITGATPAAQGIAWRYPGVNRNQPLPVQGRFRSDDKDAMLQAALKGLGCCTSPPGWCATTCDRGAGGTVPTTGALRTGAARHAMHPRSALARPQPCHQGAAVHGSPARRDWCRAVVGPFAARACCQRGCGLTLLGHGSTHGFQITVYLYSYEKSSSTF